MARRRRRNANRNPLYDPTTQLAGRRLKRAAQDLAAIEFKPAQRQLGRERTQIRTQGDALTNRASDYYLQLAREEQGNLDRLQAINSSLAGQVRQSGDVAQQQIGQAGQQAAALPNVSRAPGAPMNDQLAAEMQAARDRAAQQTQTATEGIAAGTQATAGYTDLAARARGLQGGETIGRLTSLVAGQLAENRGKQSDLASQRGAAAKSNVLQLRQQGYENLVTQAGLDIKTADLQAQVAQQRTQAQLAKQRQREVNRNNRRRAALTRAQIRAQKRGQDVTARGQDITARERALDRESRETVARRRIRYGARERGKGLSTETIKNRTGIVNAQTDIEQMLSDGRVPRELREQLAGTGLGKKAMSLDTARRVVIALGAPPIVAQAAAELAKLGAVRPSTRVRLRQAGVKVPREWMGPVKVPNRPGVTL